MLALLMILATAIPAAAAPGNGKGQGRGLSKADTELLATAKANGEQFVTLLIASKNGSNKQVVSGIESLGGQVRYREDDISYIRALVPTHMAEKAASLPGVEAAELNKIIEMDDPRPEAMEQEWAAVPPDANTPALNPYMPTQDIGAPQFVAANPTYDGRGVKIGILDSGVDILLPEFQTAKLLDGTETRKIIDFKVATDPAVDNDPSWVNMQDQVTAAGGTFTYMGQTYTAPADGQYRVGRFQETSMPTGDLNQDLNRDGLKNGVFAVLWNTSTDTVWVDTNMNQDFTDEMAMKEYTANYDVGVFGVDNPATAVRESVGFTIQLDGKNKMVNLGFATNTHGTHVAGIAAGKDFFGGAFDGVAPEAQIVSVRVCLYSTGCSGAAMLEGMIYAAKQANVDVINMSVGGLPSLNDGSSARAQLYNRLIDQYKVQIVLSAGNSGPGMNTVGDPSVAAKALAVGAYVTRDTWLVNYGADATRAEGLFPFSSRGPSEAGGFKPDIIASGAAVSTIPAWSKNVPLIGPLPEGYDMYNGTSMAAPQAAGAVALLMSAAKQAGVQHQPDQVRQAIKSSARFVGGLAAHEQGAGLVQVGAAWDLLRQNIKTAGITSKAPVSSALSGFLTPEAHFGTGIYMREGWSVGKTETLNIAFTRTTGGSKAVTYNLSWVGNDGTFSSPATLDLPHNKAVNLPVTVTGSTAGIHSAILQVDDPATTGIDYQVMNTVIVTEPFNQANNFTVSYTGSAERPDKATFFFEVPEGTPAFKVDVTAGDPSARIRFLRYHPYGANIDSAFGYQTGGTQSRTLANPFPGVWEVTVDTSRASTLAPAPFTVTASLLGATIAPSPWVVETATANTPVTQDLTFTNAAGTFTGRGAGGGTLASALTTAGTIAQGGADVEYTIDVPAGTSNLTVRIGGASDPGADLDLFVYRCITGTCVLAGSGTTASSEESVSLNNPAAGTWKAVVNPYSVPAGSTSFTYTDRLTNPMYGSVSVTDSNAVRDIGTVWTAQGSVTAKMAPPAGRYLSGNVYVATSTNTIIGSAEVRVNAVVE